MVLDIDELKDHKEVIDIALRNITDSINSVVMEAKKIHNQNYSKFSKEHSDVLNLLEKHMLKDKHGIQEESFYECLVRILKEKSVADEKK